MSYIKTFIFVVLTGCASYEGNHSFKVIRNVSYTLYSLERQQGDVYLPQGEAPFPAVVLVHGGGWKSRDRSDMDSIAQSLAGHGFVVFNINYRFAPLHRHPAPVQDLEAAIVHLKNPKYRVNPQRIGLWGYSSGGHTVTFYALTRSKLPELRVKAVVSGGAPYDFTWYPRSPYIHGYLGKYRDEMLKEYFETSPSYLVNPEAPPFFLYHAENDKLVEYPQSTAFEAKLREMKIPVQHLRVPFWGHTAAFAIPDRPVEEGIKFLKKYL